MFTKSEKHNPNYLCQIFKIENIRKHPNADRLQIVTFQGNNIITGMNAKEGDIMVYFPLECAISSDFLSQTNSFRNAEKNKDTTAKGLFEDHGRVRAARLRGSPSEGYIVPVSVLEQFSKEFLNNEISITENYVNYSFDTIHDHLLLKKYIPRGQRNANLSGKKTKGNVKKYESKLIENQFHFHSSTEQLKRYISNVQPDDTIEITEKYHGTSFVVAHVLTKKKLSRVQKLAKFLNLPIIDKEYGMIYSSRSVIKNLDLNDSAANHFYDCDIWGIVANKLFPAIKPGYTIYGEIFGYTPNGSYIQKDYDYGCNVGEYKYIIYRMTITNCSGDVFELSPEQLRAYCNAYGLNTAELHYTGKAKDLYPNIEINNHWHENFLDNLSRHFLEKRCHICNNNVPAEGIILRIDKPNKWESYKLKSFSFLQKESDLLDQNICDMETQESLVEDQNEN